MDDERRILDRLGALEGADPAALGIEPPPEPAPPGAHVEDEPPFSEEPESSANHEDAS